MQAGNEEKVNGGNKKMTRLTKADDEIIDGIVDSASRPVKNTRQQCEKTAQQHQDVLDRVEARIYARIEKATKRVSSK